jgi:hypothetical protein
MRETEIAMPDISLKTQDFFYAGVPHSKYDVPSKTFQTEIICTICINIENYALHL